MLILGIDTSCDDTSASLLEFADGHPRIITNIVSNQSFIHEKYGGIVPELASRRHIEMIWPVVSEALGGMKLSGLSAIAVCHGPGLIGSLLVGCSFAKAVSYSANVPLVGVNHLEGHLLSPFLEGRAPEFPFLALVASGGHTSLYKVKGYMDYEELGRTRDDAAGEAYDKAAKLMGLGYPGGPVIDKMAEKGNPDAVELPRPYLHESFDFSFSGLKTAVKIALEAGAGSNPNDFAASFQKSVVSALTKKVEKAIIHFGIKRVAVSGGVAANSGLRSEMQAVADARGAELYLPSMGLCTDNAAMIALAGYYRFRAGERAGLDLNPKAHLPL